MRDIGIVFFDIDGTLVDIRTKHVTELTLEALNTLKERGIKICIATGRAPTYLPQFPGVEFDAYMTFNGSYCYRDGGDIFSNPLSRRDVEQVIENATAMGRPLALATRDRIAANGVDDDLRDYFGVGNATLHPDGHFRRILAQEDVYQIMMGCHRSDYDRVLKDTRGVKIAAWWDRAVDIIPKEGGKGVGVESILSSFGLTKEQAAAFGDGNNDLEMLKAVGVGVAMGNGSPELKSAADYVCGTSAQDGIYHFLKDELGLI